MSDQYQWWRDALAGRNPAISADHPQSGYYKMRSGKDGVWRAVAIWTPEDGRQRCRVITGKEAKDDTAMNVWTWCADKPATKADFKHYIDHGYWPGEVATVGDNSGQLSLAEEIADASEQALSWLKSNGVTDKISMDTAANWRAKLMDLGKRADKEREDKIRPHITAQREINAEYKPLVDKADTTAKHLRDALSKFMAAEEEKARKAAAEAARAENERRLAEYRRQQEAAEEAALMTQEDVPVGEKPALVAPEPVRLQAGGQRGKKTSLREVTKHQIDDYAAALAHVKDHPDVIAAVEKVAFTQARAGAAVPGVSSYITKVAV